MNKKILIGSPIRQKPSILKQFLESLEHLNKTKINVDYYFIDDNEDSNSSLLLKQFAKKHKNKAIINNWKSDNAYACDENTHQWNDVLIWKVAQYKNSIIDHCINNEYDYLFLVDSDLLLHPETLIHLIYTEKDIISEIFWTKWRKELNFLPQVWIKDQYELVRKNSGEILSQEDYRIRQTEFLKELIKPGIYEVGGLGACTIVSRDALLKGVNFNEITNVSFSGEDRHFCIRASALGIKLFVDTHFPAYHLYRESDIKGIDAYRAGNPLLNEIAKELGLDYTDSYINNLVTSFFQRYLSCDYRVYTSFEGINLLSDTMRNAFLNTKERIINAAREYKLKCTSEVKEINITNTQNGKIQADAKFTLNISDVNSERKCDFSVNLNICKASDNAGMIDYIEFKNDSGQCILGFTVIDLISSKIRVCKASNNKITLAMLVHNEANKFLPQVLAHAARYIDNAVILDDASTDNTVEICKSSLDTIPLEIVSNRSRGFSNEINLRKQLWDLATKKEPDWILCLDADEMFEDSIIDNIQLLINQPNFDYYSFRLYDMWDFEHYREDTYWQAHKFFRPFLVRYQPEFQYTWHETPQHCGRLPNNIGLLKSCCCYIRLKHYGWVTPQLRLEKYERYMRLDPEGKYGNINQYRSIKDEIPRLIEWK